MRNIHNLVFANEAAGITVVKDSWTYGSVVLPLLKSGKSMLVKRGMGARAAEALMNDVMVKALRKNQMPDTLTGKSRCNIFMDEFNPDYGLQLAADRLEARREKWRAKLARNCDDVLYAYFDI